MVSWDLQCKGNGVLNEAAAEHWIAMAMSTARACSDATMLKKHQLKCCRDVCTLCMLSCTGMLVPRLCQAAQQPNRCLIGTCQHIHGAQRWYR